MNPTAGDAAPSLPLARLSGIHKSYFTDEIETHALSDVQLDIHAGEFLAIAGPSGCGKSTLLNVLGLLEASERGDYWLDGQLANALPLDAAAALRNEKLGFIFQSFNLLGSLTVFENVELPLIYRGEESAARRREAVESALARVEMDHRAKHYPSQLSGGQQQRVAVARAVVGRPELLLADEPTGNLDTKSAEAVMSLLSGLHASGSTIFMVTHDPRYASISSRTVHMLDGRVLSP